MADTVLVTGANGFIAHHVIARLLGVGYRVRGTVRSEAKGESARAAWPPRERTSPSSRSSSPI